MFQTAQNATAALTDDTAMHDELRLHGFTSTKQLLCRLVELLQAIPTVTNTFEVIMAIDADDLVRPCIKSTAPNGVSKNLFRRDCEWVYHALTGHKPLFY